MRSSPVPYTQKLAEIEAILSETGNLSVLLIDLAPISQVERDYGTEAFTKVLSSATELVRQLRGTVVRSEDILATTEKGDDAIVIFLSPRRSVELARISEIQNIAKRIEIHLHKKLARRASPFVRQPSKVTVGYAFSLKNPLIQPARLVARLVQDARDCVRFQRLKRQFENRLQLQEILINEEVRTFFQPIVDIRDETILGYEALSRGPKDSPLQSPLQLFETAAESDLVFELDRLCRRAAFENVKGISPHQKIFVNIMPSALYDPDFQGSNLIGLLDSLELAPSQVVFELTEKFAIENYSLFADAIHDFTQMGFAFAVDDIGAGHSGLEKIAHLSPQYLKFDMDLIRDIDTSFVRREIVTALKNLGEKMDSTIIAEGIERKEELETLVGLGVPYGQGYLLGRPEPKFSAQAKEEAEQSPSSAVPIGQIKLLSH
jgi:EAL domain-containing protein (putative c-di-GMP-specific phosphodiesterase class I)